MHVSLLGRLGGRERVSMETPFPVSLVGRLGGRERVSMETPFPVTVSPMDLLSTQMKTAITLVNSSTEIPIS